MADYRISVDTRIDTRKLDNFEKRINSLRNKPINVDVDIRTGKADSKLKNIKNSVKSLGKNANVNINAGVKVKTSSIEKEVKKIQGVLNAKKIDLDILNMKSGAGKLSSVARDIGNIDNKIADVERGYRKLQDAQEAFNNGKINAQSLVNTYDELRTTINSVNGELKVMAKTADIAFDTGKLKSKIDLISKRESIWMKKNSKIKGTVFEDQMQTYLIDIQTAGSMKELSALEAKINGVKKAAELAGKTGQSFVDNFMGKVRQIGEFASILQIGQLAREMFNSVLEIDTAMTGLYRVTDLTASQYDSLFKDMIASSREYGQTLKDTINATTDWVRAGYDAKTSLGLAEVTAMYQHVSDLDYDIAAENLLTAYNGFKDSFQGEFGNDVVSSVEHVADAFNELDNKYSVTSAGLGAGLARSASALQLAGNSFEQAAALVGATAEVQQDPEKAGQAMKTLSLRLRGMKGELESLGEESEGVENISKMQGQILNMTHGKVNIFGDNGEFRSTYDIMRDIADVYDELTSTEQANLLETIAGKNRANDVAALIGNFQRAIDMVNTAENSFGSASAENEKYVQSLQGRIDVLTASFQTMSESALSSDFLKGAVDVIDAVVNGITGLIDTFGLIPAGVGLATGAMALFGKNSILQLDLVNKKVKLFGKDISKIGEAFKGVGGGDKTIGSAFLDTFESNFDKMRSKMSEQKRQLQEYLDLKDSGESQHVLAEKFNSLDAEVRDYIQTVGTAKASQEGLEQNMQELAWKTNTASTSLRSQISVLKEYNREADESKRKQMAKQLDGTAMGGTAVGQMIAGALGSKVGMKTALGSLGKMLPKALAGLASKALGAIGSAFLGVAGGMLIDVVVNGLFDLIGNWFNDTFKAAEQIEERVGNVAAKIEEAKSKADGAKSVVDEFGSSYERLSKGVDTKTNANISLSTSEYKEYLDIVNKIAGSMPGLISGYDAQGNAILSAAGNVKALNEELKQLKLEQANAVLKPDEETGYKGLSDLSKKYINDTEALNKDFSKNNNKALDNIIKSGDIHKAILDTSYQDQRKIAEKLHEQTGIEYDMVDVEVPYGRGGQTTTRQRKEYASEYIERVLKDDTSTARNIIEQYNNEYQQIAAEYNKGAQALMDKIIYGDSSFDNMSDVTKTMLSNYISNLDGEFYDNLIETSGGNKDDLDKYLSDYIADLTSTFKNFGKDGEKALQDALKSKTEFDSGKISMNDFYKDAQRLDKIFSDMGLDLDQKKDFMASIGIEFEYDDNGSLKRVTKDFEQVKNMFSNNKNKKSIEAWLGTLSGQELDIVANMELNGKENVDELQRLLDLEKALQGVGTIDIQVESDSLAALNGAITASNGATGMNAEQISAIRSRYSELEGYDAAALFEKTTTGVRLNTEALASLEEQYINTKKAASQQNLSTLMDEYSRLAKLKEEAANAGNESEASKYDSQLSTLEEEINKAQEVISMYDGMTSAYKQWVDAKSNGQEGDMYTDVTSGRENAVKLAEAGKWGNTELQNYVEMFTSPDVDLDTPQQYADAWGSAIGKSKRYFQEGRDGITNFMRDVHNANSDLVTMNSDGSFNIQPGFDTKDFAKAAGVAESTVEALFGMMSEYGFDVPIGIDEMSVEELVKQSNDAAQRASDALKPVMGEDFNIEVKADIKNVEEADAEIERLKAQRDEINNSDATVEVKQQGVDAVNSSIESVIAKKIELENPAFMQLDASQVKSTMVDALSSLQSYQTALNEVKRLEALQNEGIEIDTGQLDAAKAKVDETAQAIAGLPEEVKVAIGLEGDDGVDAIKQKISEGKVTLSVDTEVDKTQTEQLASNIDKIQDKDVTITAKVEGLDEVRELAKKIDVTANVEGNIENLDKFVESAKKLKDVNDETTVRINAYLDSNLHGDKTAQLDNLPEFISALDKLRGKDGTTEVRLEAYLDSDIHGDKTAQLDNLPKFVDVYDKLRGKDGTTEIHLKAYLDSDVHGDKEAQLNNLPKYVEVAQGLQGISSKRVDIQAYLDSDVHGDKEAQLNNLPKYVEVAQGLQGVSPNISVVMSAKIDAVADYESINKIASFANAAQQLKDVSSVNVSVSTSADIGAINSVKSALQALSDSGVMKNYTASVSVSATTTNLGSNFTGSGKADMSAKTKNMGSDFTGSGKVDMSPDSLDLGGGFYGSATINVKPNTYNLGNLFTGTATIKTKSAGGGGGGTFANGTAFSQGNWSTKDSGTALMGELGRETIVRDGHFFTVGDNGAEFVKYRKGDIIFNHKQTEELFKNGYVTSGGGRGKAYVEGTAFANVGSGSWRPGGIRPSYNYNVSSGNSKSTKSSKSSDSKASEEAEKFEEVLDLVEIALDRIERAVKNLDVVASSTFRGWSERTSALNEQIAQTTNEIDLQQRSYDRYMKAANEVGLSADWQNKIKNGKVDIELVTDSDLKDKIDQYQQW